MYRLLYILPVAAMAVTYIVVGVTEWWPLYLILALIAEMAVVWAVYRVRRDREYLSGYATAIYHHEPWTERVVQYVPYTDSRGKTHTRRVVTYVHHPDEWFCELNTEECIDIAAESYYDICNMWTTEEEQIYPPHTNCVAGGGGQRLLFDDDYEHLVTATYEGLYINYVRDSNSIFRHEEISDKEAATIGLIEYPPFEGEGIDVDAVLASPMLKGVEVTSSMQRAIQCINGYYGAEAEIHIFVLLFDATQGIAAAMKQRQYWHGGNKNELVVCLGIEPASDAAAMHEVAWCKAFSWCDAPQLDNATESWFIEHRRLDIEGYAKWLRDNINLWHRKSFKDFKYMGKRLSPRRTLMLSIFTLVVSALAVVMALAMTVW
ncbi:MAG: hypothetical protein IKB15_06085 [Alistipes sp.]|nr:hypothetical protein [Alistipes sp.]